jgi:hypothetical protein
VSDLFSSVIRDELTTHHEPGRAVLKVDRSSGDGWIVPYSFGLVSASASGYPTDLKPRVTVRVNTSDDALLISQGARSIMPTVKGAVPVDLFTVSPSVVKLVKELLLARLVPFINVVDAHGDSCIYGLQWNHVLRRGEIAVFSKSVTSRSCDGLPSVTLANCSRELNIIPNSALLTIIKGFIDDPTPDHDAYIARWFSVVRVFFLIGLATVTEIDTYLAGRGFNLTDEQRSKVAANHSEALKIYGNNDD